MTRLSVSLACFLTAATLQTAHAEGPALPAATPDLATIDLPVMDRATLLETLESLRSRLILRKQELTRRVTDSRLDSGELLLTAILPGGLIYAGYRKARHEQAKDDLACISADIRELSSDLLAMESTTAAVVVAQSP
ncbi:MAG: hypothetical protein PVI50_08400 [Gammaproteobacteria bacterium]|jgi:hypothetical protein